MFLMQIEDWGVLENQAVVPIEGARDTYSKEEGKGSGVGGMTTIKHFKSHFLSRQNSSYILFFTFDRNS